jgi:hypothetical protein
MKMKENGERNGIINGVASSASKSAGGINIGGEKWHQRIEANGINGVSAEKWRK